MNGYSPITEAFIGAFFGGLGLSVTTPLLFDALALRVRGGR